MTSVIEDFEEFRSQYWAGMETLFNELLLENSLEDSSLKFMLEYHLRTGGKRLRAILPLLVAKALGVNPKRLLAFGAACELIHNATLVHDDLQDGDALRRGEATIWAKFGEPEAINLGDAMLYLAPLCLEKSDFDEKVKWLAARRMFRDILQVIDGQEREFALKGITVSRQAYERMVIGKTSGLFALPIAGAAELCGASREVVEALEMGARELGVLFQMQDDILDLYGEKGRESRGGDIREGKISMLVVAFKEVAPEEDFQMLLQMLEAPREETSEVDVEWAIEALRTSGALGLALEEISSREAKILAIEALKDYPEIGTLLQGLVQIFLRPIAGLREVSQQV